MSGESRAADDKSALAFFLELLRIDSPSGSERRAGRACAAWMEDMGLSVAWEPVSLGDTVSANLWAFAPGDPALDPVLVCAHLDTRWAGVPDVRRRSDGWMESGNDVPLGADDKAGVAAVMAGMARILREGRSHPPIHILLSAGEELGSAGVRASRRIAFSARRALVVDAEAPVGTLVEAGYGQARVWLRYAARGEADRFSVWRALQEATVRTGFGLTCELVRFVPSDTGCEAEVAVWFSPDVDGRIAKARYRSWVAELERSTEPRDVRAELVYPAYDVRASSWLHAVRSRMERGVGPVTCVRMRDGCDANWLASMGLLPINVGVGYESAHTRAERIHEESLVRLTRLLVAALSEP